jgi:hypothetical protein
VVGNGSWSKPWRGDQSARLAAPADMQSAGIREGQAWQRLTLTSQAPASLARAGVSVFMRGQFWDQGSAGDSFASHNGSTISAPPREDKPGQGARLINVWL